ncbi:MAG: autotransporter domain-containing protein [Pseudomonadota bacterium]
MRIIRTVAAFLLVARVWALATMGIPIAALAPGMVSHANAQVSACLTFSLVQNIITTFNSIVYVFNAGDRITFRFNLEPGQSLLIRFLGVSQSQSNSGTAAAPYTISFTVPNTGPTASGSFLFAADTNMGPPISVNGSCTPASSSTGSTSSDSGGTGDNLFEQLNELNQFGSREPNGNDILDLLKPPVGAPGVNINQPTGQDNGNQEQIGGNDGQDENSSDGLEAAIRKRICDNLKKQKEQLAEQLKQQFETLEGSAGKIDPKLGAAVFAFILRGIGESDGEKETFADDFIPVVSRISPDLKDKLNSNSPEIQNLKEELKKIDDINAQIEEVEKQIAENCPEEDADNGSESANSSEASDSPNQDEEDNANAQGNRQDDDSEETTEEALSEKSCREKLARIEAEENALLAQLKPLEAKLAETENNLLKAEDALNRSTELVENILARSKHINSTAEAIAKIRRDAGIPLHNNEIAKYTLQLAETKKAIDPIKKRLSELASEKAPCDEFIFNLEAEAIAKAQENLTSNYAPERRSPHDRVFRKVLSDGRVYGASFDSGRFGFTGNTFLGDPNAERPWLIFLNTGVSGLFDSGAVTDRESITFNAALGAAVQMDPLTRFSLTATFKTGEARDDALNAELDGETYGVSLSLARQVTENIALNLAAGYRYGDNDLNIAGVTSSFTADIFSASASLSSSFLFEDYTVSPNLSINASHTERSGYTDSAGTVVPENSFSNVNASLGASISKTFTGSGRIVSYTPTVGVNAGYQFRNEDFQLINGAVAPSFGFGGSVNSGVSINLENGASFGVNGGYGLFQEGNTWTASGTLSIPLN